MSCLVKGVHSPKAKIKASLFQPLNLLDLVVSHKEKSELQYLREVRLEYPFIHIPGDIRKTSILLFLNELLYKSIQEESAHAELFEFIHDQLVYLDQEPDISGNYHLLFALHLTRLLGFFPHGTMDGPDMVFSLPDGHFTHPKDLFGEQTISGRECEAFAAMLAISPQDHAGLSVSASTRHALLEKMLLYYRLHLPITGEFKSHHVLHEVLKK